VLPRVSLPRLPCRVQDEPTQVVSDAHYTQHLCCDCPLFPKTASPREILSSTALARKARLWQLGSTADEGGQEGPSRDKVRQLYHKRPVRLRPMRKHFQRVSCSPAGWHKVAKLADSGSSAGQGSWLERLQKGARLTLARCREPRESTPDDSHVVMYVHRPTCEVR
jgi:hypothetical protein